MEKDEAVPEARRTRAAARARPADWLNTSGSTILVTSGPGQGRAVCPGILHHDGEAVRLVLRVRIQEPEPVAPRLARGDVQGVRLARPAGRQGLDGEHADPRVPLGESGGDVGRAVAAAV